MTVVDAVMVGLCILLLTFGEVGYMVYGDETEDMITNNLPRNVFTDVVMVRSHTEAQAPTHPSHAACNATGRRQ